MQQPSPQLLSTLSAYFLRRGSSLSGGNLQDGTIGPEKLSFQPATQDSVAQAQASAEQAGQQALGSTEQAGANAGAIQTLQSQVSTLIADLSNLATENALLKNRVEDLENLMDNAAQSETMSVVDESNPAERIVIDVDKGLVTSIVREVI